MRWWSSLLAVSLLVAGCGSTSPDVRTYEVRGQVLGVRPEIREVMLAHEEIVGYMPPMSMSFGVKDAALLSGLQRGDLIRATLHVAETDAWLSTIEKTGHAEVTPEPEPGTDPAKPAGGPTTLLEPGQPVPETTLTDQDGKPFSIADARGKAVALTFIYTRCPLPTFCPLMDRHFAAAQRLIENRPDLRGRARLVSVSFDPTYDTPTVLREHAARVGAKPDAWRFVTADVDVIDGFALAFGVSVIRDEKDAANIVHNLRTAVVGPDGRVRTILSGGDWTPEQLVRELASSLP